MTTSQHSNVSKLLQYIASVGKTFLANGDESSRESLIELAELLRAQLETPSEFGQRIGFAEPARNTAIRLGVDLGIFDQIAASRSPTNVEAIADQSGADTTLVARTMKHLAAMHVVKEEGQDQYSSTALSKGLTVKEHRSGVCYLFDVAAPSFQAMPAYLQKTGYKNPGNILDGPFQYAHKTELPFFAYLNQRPLSLAHFNNYMGGFRAGKPSWLDFYPANSRLIEGAEASPDAALLVDVGGGLGHDLKTFRERHSDAPGRLVLQDRPEVIAAVGGLDGIGVTAHDFFKSQPIQGARAYYLHSVLHDWDDASCVRILKRLRSAMKSGYSRILINEYVVQNVGATWSVTSMDWLMMALGAVKERTEAQWAALLASAGLRFVKVWMADQGTESLIEAELAD